MIEISIPGFNDLRLEHLVLDYNGTLAADGYLIPGVRELLGSLAELLEIHVITADTHGVARKKLKGLPVSLTIVDGEAQADAKLAYLRDLDAATVVAVGNGRNDRKMLHAAAVGIALIQKEGASVETLTNADLVATNILDALELLLHPQRLVATLRS